MDRNLFNPTKISVHGPKCYCSIPNKCIFHFKEDKLPYLGLVSRVKINTVLIKFHDDEQNDLISGGYAENTEEPNHTEATNAPQFLEKMNPGTKASKHPCTSKQNESSSVELHKDELDTGFEKHREYYAKLFEHLKLSSNLNSSASKENKLVEKYRNSDDDFEYFIPKSNISPKINSLKRNKTPQPYVNDRVRDRASVVRNLCDEFTLLCKTKSSDASQNDEIGMQIENTDTETRIKESNSNHNRPNIGISLSGSETRDLFQYKMKMNLNVNNNIEECHTKELNLFGQHSPPYSSISDSSDSPMMGQMDWSTICSTLGISEDRENVTSTKAPVFKKPFPIDSDNNNKPGAITLLPSSRDTRCSTQELFMSQRSPSDQPSLNFNTCNIENSNDSFGMMSVELTEVKNVTDTCDNEKMSRPELLPNHKDRIHSSNHANNLDNLIAKSKLAKPDKAVPEVTDNEQDAVNYGVILFEEECVDNPFRKQIQPNCRTDCDNSQNEVASSYVTIPSSSNGPSQLSLNRKLLKCVDYTLIHSLAGVGNMNFTCSKKKTQLKKKKQIHAVVKSRCKKRTNLKLEHKGCKKLKRL